MKTACITLITASTLYAATTAAQPALSSMSDQQIRTEIKTRCQEQMSEYGDSLALACMRQNWAAVQAIRSQRAQHPHITKRCLHQMRDYGYSLVTACIRQNASAQQKIKSW